MAKAKTGRPRIEINWDEFAKLCSIQCTLQEIASWFECSEDTIERAVKREKELSFAEFYEQKAATGKISLRRKQWQLALGGDKTMLIWLGKQHLEQTERKAVELSGELNNPFAEKSIEELEELLKEKIKK